MKKTALILSSILLIHCSDPKTMELNQLQPSNSDEGVVVNPYSSKIMGGFSATDSNLVTLTNWDVAPYNRWSYQHFRELVPTQNIPRGVGPVNSLSREPKKLDTVNFTDSKGNDFTVRQMLDKSFTDGFIVLKDGKILMEEYFTGMKPSSHHLLQSASKSLTVALLAILINEGKIHENGKVSDYIPELKNSGYAGATIASLMDMQSGVSYSYGKGPDDLNSDLGRHLQSWLWKPRNSSDKGQRYFLGTLKKGTDPGKIFQYKDSDTEILNWIMEKTSERTFAELFSDRIWSRIGVEYDAYVSCDGLGSAVTSGGINVTLRDFARIGQLFLEKGKRGNEQLVPAAFFDDILNSRDTAKFAASMFAEGFSKGSAYNNHFWIPGSFEDAYLAFGYQGQYLFVHPKYNVVIAKFSTQPTFDMQLSDVEWRGFYAISKALHK